MAHIESKKVSVAYQINQALMAALPISVLALLATHINAVYTWLLSNF